MLIDVARASFVFAGGALLALAWAVRLVAAGSEGSWRAIFLSATVSLVIMAGVCFCVAVRGVAN